MRRPSASVLSTSTVLPLRIFSTSPGRMALPLGMFSTSGTYPVTRVFTPSAASVDIAAITAAPPPMSVFIVSMPPAVLSERPPESNTTPLPTSASGLPRAPDGAYVIFRKRGACSEPWPTPSTPPMRCACELLHVEHLHGDARAAQQLARRGDHVGRRLLLRRPVHQVARPGDRVPDRRRRARPRPATGAPPAAMIVTFFELRRCGVALVLEVLVATEHEALGHRLRGIGDRELGAGSGERGGERRHLRRRDARRRRRRGAGRRG